MKLMRFFETLEDDIGDVGDFEDPVLGAIQEILPDVCKRLQVNIDISQVHSATPQTKEAGNRRPNNAHI
jgi:hypothetical protein